MGQVIVECTSSVNVETQVRTSDIQLLSTFQEILPIRMSIKPSNGASTAVPE